MPATEPNFLVTNAANYPPELARAMRDLLDRSPFFLTLPIAYTTADAATLYTVPSDRRMLIISAAWEISVSFTGGTSSAIGLSSDDTNASTKGDILGGASGDVAAGLLSTGVPIKGGTVGAKFGSNGRILLAAGKLVRFDRITSAFTAGSGFVHLQCAFLPTS
jgi:hypothetical protein